MASSMILSCVGMRHRVTPSTLREIAKTVPLKVKFEREPDNLYDENAIRVICDERPWGGMHIGYVARQSAAEIAPRIDRKKIELTVGYLTSMSEGSGSGEMMVEFKKTSK